MIQTNVLKTNGFPCITTTTIRTFSPPPLPLPTLLFISTPCQYFFSNLHHLPSSSKILVLKRELLLLYTKPLLVHTTALWYNITQQLKKFYKISQNCTKWTQKYTILTCLPKNKKVKHLSIQSLFHYTYNYWNQIEWNSSYDYWKNWNGKYHNNKNLPKSFHDSLVSFSLTWPCSLILSV